MTEFTPGLSVFGGLLIGLSAALGFAFFGRVIGISGILGRALQFDFGEIQWRVWFLVGLIGMPLLLELSVGSLHGFNPAPPMAMVIAGLLVGYGTRLGSGCTSGHGICGISRLSIRSVVATGCFMVSAIITVFVVRHVLGVN
ncbi:MAG: YeeE/YedE family protein [Gammaproteobacteria bacterium]|nr:YeeE/YedE family protein [Gammaproteobacteria bacterium]